ncbi:MAG: DUF6797 domain-containing protein [Rubritalea sp.]|uniref:DUF6797 domain-containing protein n=1 Tax=Rubritalea sp. TaxID=2109375 RepID=UPI0032426173
MKFIMTLLLIALSHPLSAQMLLSEDSLPEYEKFIDHARLIKSTNRRVINQGKAIYKNVCNNCHGDINNEGSVPTSLRFASGKFQHGSDPYTMYQTITRGWRTMPPQVQLTPREKYAVIHYIRSQYLKPHNPSQLFKVTPEFLAKLPEGKSLGPEPAADDRPRPWNSMDYGDFLISTYEIATPEKRATPAPQGTEADYLAPDANIAYKGIALRLDPGKGGVSEGKTWSTFEHDSLRVAGVWQGSGFIDWKSILFDGSHVTRPRTIGKPLFETSDTPGWANPETGNFDDQRLVGLDQLRYGPLPRKWAHYKGLYKHGSQTIISYSVGDADILEKHGYTEQHGFVRHLNIGKSTKDLIVRLANAGTSASVNGHDSIRISTAHNFVTATIPAAITPVKLSFSIGKKNASAPTTIDLTAFTKGGPSQWPQAIQASIKRGTQDGPFQWDNYDVPQDNPWKSRIRTTGIEFSPDGKSIIVCCWDGDVWRVDGMTGSQAKTTTWKRIASGLFQPLGIVVRDKKIYITCRDQIVCLHDLNGDGETDFYENFNSDSQVTNHFHEFAMGLQSDEAGNFYYARSGRHARPPLVPHHGTLLKVSADGSKTEILAKGFRAANGVCLNADGTFFVTDQEGHWNPMNRINHVLPSKNYFYGNMWGYGAPEDSSDSLMEQPLCWVDRKFDRSPAELLWVDSKKWGPLDGKLIHLSYGHGRLSLVPHETIDGKKQGGMVRLPIPDLPTGIMRGRFNPEDGQLYTCGMAAWATSQTQKKGGLFRIRATGKPFDLPTDLKVDKDGVHVTFSNTLDPTSVTPSALTIQTWDYERSAKYGSRVFNKKGHPVTSVTLSPDGKTLSFKINELSTCWQMSVNYRLKAQSGDAVVGEIQNTIHTLE